MSQPEASHRTASSTLLASLRIKCERIRHESLRRASPPLEHGMSTFAAKAFPVGLVRASICTTARGGVR